MGQEEGYSLKYHRLIPDDIAHLDTFWRERIAEAVGSKLPAHPEIFGKPLRRTLKGCRALRVGDYRVVFRIEQRVIRILAIIHRSSDYKNVEKRIGADLV